MRQKNTMLSLFSRKIQVDTTSLRKLSLSEGLKGLRLSLVQAISLMCLNENHLRSHLTS